MPPRRNARYGHSSELRNIMQRTKQDIQALIEKGETFHLECKKAQGGLPSSLWESYSAFCNTDGGVILLGVKEFEGKHFEVVGVSDAQKLVQDFTNTLNDRNKVSANVLTDKNVQIIDCDERMGIVICRWHDRIEFRNPGTLRMPVEDAYKGWKSDCRNKGLQKMFQFLGYSEKAGSGFPKIFMGTDEQHWARPFLQEDFKFEQTTLTMPTVDLTENDTSPEGGVKGGVKTTTDRILAMIESDPSVTYQKLAREIGVTENAITKHIKHLTVEKLIRRVGPKKGGHWEIVTPQPPTGDPGS